MYKIVEVADQFYQNIYCAQPAGCGGEGYEEKIDFEFKEIPLKNYNT